MREGSGVLNEDVKLFLNTSTRFRAPEINELFSDGLHHGSAAIEKGDMSMKEERVYSLNAGFSFNHNRWMVVAEPFFHYFINYIYLKPENTTQLSIRGAFPVFQHTQTNASYLGIDFDARYRLNSHLTLSTNASLVQIKDLQTESFIYGTPPIHIGTELNYKNKELDNFKSLSFALQPNYTFKQFLVDANEDFAPPPEAYFLLNFTGQAEFKNRPAAISMRVVNVLNNTYRSYLNRYRYFAQEQGIQLFLTLNIYIK